jgi:hypothetical protein
VKILTVGKKGREQLKRDYADLFVGHVDLSEVKRIGFAPMRRRSRKKVLDRSTRASSTSPRSSSTASSR